MKLKIIKHLRGTTVWHTKYEHETQKCEQLPFRYSSTRCGISSPPWFYVAEEKLPRPGNEPTTVWLTDGHANNFIKELSSLPKAVITQASHNTPFYIYTIGASIMQ